MSVGVPLGVPLGFGICGSRMTGWGDVAQVNIVQDSENEFVRMFCFTIACTLTDSLMSIDNVMWV